MRLKCFCFAALIFVVGCSRTAPRLRPPDPQLTADYERLLGMFPEDNQGLGRENLFKTISQQPMTYGLVLSAECARYTRINASEAARRARKAARWLVENQDLDGDGQPGWGLPEAWDAFQDGTTNPENQPYTITTALVMISLLDFLQTDLPSPAERDEIRRLLARVAVRWCNFWSEGFSAGFFWYSTSRADAHFAVNSPSMFIGALARLLHEQPSALAGEGRQLVQARMDDQARSVVATVAIVDGLPYWSYMPLPNYRNSARPNDLIHHVYTLWGAELYRGLGGAVKLPWTREQAVRSLDRFWCDGHICMFPEIPAASQPTEAGRMAAASQPAGSARAAGLSNREAILWSAGMLLGGYAMWGDETGATRTLAAIHRDYGPWPTLRLFPPQQSSDDKFYPRHASHVLLGMAWHVFGERRAD